MILSERQFRTTEAQLEKLRVALAATPTESGDWKAIMMRDALRSQIADLNAELAHYELLRGGQLSYATEYSLRQLPSVLVGARIAKGWSQTDLADALNMKPQQVQRYEATEYMAASLSRLIEVADVLGVKVQETYSANTAAPSGEVVAWRSVDDLDWSRFPIAEMLKRGWLSLSGANDNSRSEAVRQYFMEAAGPRFVTALHRKKVRSERLPDEYALLAWQARVLSVARASEAQVDTEFAWRDEWLEELRSFTRFLDGPSRAKRLLARQGILLVLEAHLSGTYLDGAAMTAHNGRPIVAITLRYDRLDHFWFVLMHELGHVLLHLSVGAPYDFFDTEEVPALDKLEAEADQFALSSLISDRDWDTCLSRFALTEEAVAADAERLGVGEAIVAGRIRKERNDYEILNKCVGSGLVREQFWG